MIEAIWSHLAISVSRRKKHIIYKKFKIGTGTGIGIVFFINNAAKPVVCEVWHMRRTFAWPQNFHKQVVPPLFIEVPVQKQGSEGSCLCARCIDFARFYQFWIIFCNCSDGLIFHFILLQTIISLHTVTNNRVVQLHLAF